MLPDDSAPLTVRCVGEECCVEITNDTTSTLSVYGSVEICEINTLKFPNQAVKSKHDSDLKEIHNNLDKVKKQKELAESSLNESMVSDLKAKSDFENSTEKCFLLRTELAKAEEDLAIAEEALRSAREIRNIMEFSLYSAEKENKGQERNAFVIEAHLDQARERLTMTNNWVNDYSVELKRFEFLEEGVTMRRALSGALEYDSGFTSDFSPYHHFLATNIFFNGDNSRGFYEEFHHKKMMEVSKGCNNNWGFTLTKAYYLVFLLFFAKRPTVSFFI